MGPDSDRDAPTVGLLGDVPNDLSAVVEDLDVRPVVGGTVDVLAAEPNWIVAGGEAAVLDLVRAGVDRPVLPVAAGRGVGSVPREDAATAVEAVLGGDAQEESRRLVSVAVDDATATALFDVTVLTAEAAQISEYTIWTGNRRVASLRADGIVVATPAGSDGYAEDVGGPVVEPGSDVVSVVPIAPFVTDAKHWVLSLGAVTIEAKRNEPVQVIVDDRAWREIEPGETVRVEAAGLLRLLDVSASRGFGTAAAGLEKL